MDDYLWMWTERRGPLSVLRVRGDLDVVTADRFAAVAARQLRQTTGPVLVDLSFLDYVDCAGARVLAAILDSIPPWQLTDVCGIQPAVRRLLDLMGLDVAVGPGLGDMALSPRGRELMAGARLTRSQSQEMLLKTSVVMSRLATTFEELAEARKRRAAQEQADAGRMMALSDTARTLSARYRQRAAASTR